MQFAIEEQELGRARSWNLRARHPQQARSKSRSYRTPRPARKPAHKRSTRTTGCVVDNEITNPKISQVTGNFNRIARDLDRALRAGRFTTVQRALIDEAREASWSFAPRDPRPFTLNFSAIARNLRFERMGLSRQFRRLVEDRVFIDLGDGRYLINKDYRQWLDAGRPRLSPEQVRWCLRIKVKGRTEHAGTHPPEHAGTQSGFSGVSTPVRTPVVNYAHPPEHAGTQSPTDYAHPGPESLVGPPDPPIGTRPQTRARVSLESKRESSLENSSTPPPEKPTRPCPPYPGQDGPLMVHGGPHATSDADAREIWSLLWKAFGDERLNNGFFEHQDWYPADCWVAAIRELARRGSTPRGIKLVETLAADYKANGVPAASPVAGQARRPPFVGDATPRKETLGERRSREIKEQVAAMKAKYAAGDGKEADVAGR